MVLVTREQFSSDLAKNVLENGRVQAFAGAASVIEAVKSLAHRITHANELDGDAQSVLADAMSAAGFDVSAASGVVQVIETEYDRAMHMFCG